MSASTINRRDWIAAAAGSTVAAAATSQSWAAAADNPLRYMLASCMYGTMSIEEILPEVKKIGATAIDLWPRVHGNQREQLDEMGEAKFAQLLADHDVTLGCLTQYKLGPFKLQSEMQVAQRLGCPLIVSGGSGPKGLTGSELKLAVADFVEKMKPHLAVAEETGVTIAIENHGNNLIESPDSLRWLAEMRPSPRLGIALAPYHLPQDPQLIADLIVDLADSLQLFYAWQHGMGSVQKLPKDQELLQMPGRGELDFQPLVAALAKINFAGPTEIFMHPVPRGVPILPTADAVSAEINRSRDYLQTCWQG